MEKAETLEQRYPRTFIELNDLLFSDDYSDYHHSVAVLTLNLYQSLEAQFNQEFPERDLIIAWLAEKSGGELSLNELISNIKKSRKLGSQFLLAFIASDVHEKAITHDKVLFYKYKSLTLAVVFQLILAGTHESAYHRICDEMRMFANGKRSDLMRYLPEIREQYLSGLNQELTEQREKASDQNLPSIVDQISKYIVPYDAVSSGKDEILRAPSKKREKNKYSLYRKSVADVDTQGNNVSEISEQLVRGKRSTTWQREEKDSTPLDVKIYNVDLKDQTKEPAANHVLAKAISQRLVLRKLKLPTQVDVLTDHALNKVVEACLNDATAHGSQLILLILATGLSPEQLAQIKFKKSKNNTAFYRYHKLPSYEQTPEFKKYIPTVLQKFLITLPECITRPSPYIIYDSIPAAKEILSSLNRKYKLNLTMERLRLNMRAWLTKQSVDSAILGVLCGDDLKQQPGMYYTLIDESVVLGTYREYITDLFSKKIAATLPHESDDFIGSNLPVLTPVITFQLDRIKESYKQSTEPIIKHFFLAIYTYYIVALFSGYRPVTAMLGYFQDMNHITGSYTISDKENREGISARTIILPQIAMQQIDLYKQSITDFTNRYTYKYPELSERCNQALKTKDAAPWLFFEDDGEIIEPNPGALDIYLRKFFPMAENWHRHWARSCLIEFDLGQDITDAWIGHADIEQEGFGRYSSLSSADFKNVADHFDRKAEEMGVTTIDG